MITFKQFLAESATGAHGEYIGNVAEKTMVNSIINQLFGGQKTEQNYERVYSFIESDVFEAAYDKYYDAFKEKSEVSYEAKRGDGKKRDLTPESAKLIDEFKKELRELWEKWKAKPVAEAKGAVHPMNKPELRKRYDEYVKACKIAEKPHKSFGSWALYADMDAVKEAKSDKLHSGTKNGSRAYKDYTNFKGVSADEKRELKKEMDRELKKFKDSDHKDPDSYPKINGKTDWPADKKYREKLKKRGKKIPKSDSTIAYQRMYGDKK